MLSTTTEVPAPARLPHRGSGAVLWLARHAKVHEDWHGKAYGSLDVPLSAAGTERTAVFGAALATLAPAAVHSSPLQRARLLGERVATLGKLHLQLDDRLREIDRGRWQGLAVEELHARHADEVRAFYADPWSFREHGGENDAAVFERAASVVHEATAELGSGATLVLTSHYNVIRVLLTTALGLPPARSFGLRLDPAHAAVLRDGPHGWELVHTNVDAPPLPLDESQTPGAKAP